MAKKVIITIARQYGSGGREIGERVAELLGIPIYDKEIINAAAEKGNLNVEVIKSADESAANSLLYTLAMGSNVIGTTMHFGYKMPINDKLFILQSEVIKDYAEKGSCVVIGRCSDHVLRDVEGVFRLFIYGDLEHRKVSTIPIFLLQGSQSSLVPSLSVLLFQAVASLTATSSSVSPLLKLCLLNPQ